MLDAEQVYTMDDISDVIKGLQDRLYELQKEYHGRDKETIRQLIYELEKARNVLE